MIRRNCAQVGSKGTQRTVVAPRAREELLDVGVAALLLAHVEELGIITRWTKCQWAIGRYFALC